MTITKIKKKTKSFRARLNYVFRGDSHEHKLHDEQGKLNVRFISGSTFQRDPYVITGDVVNVNIDLLESEFLERSAQCRGKNESHCCHYIISLAPQETLSDQQWQNAGEILLRQLGYDCSVVWCGAIHNDSQCQHMHIVSSSILSNGRSINQHNDYHMAMRAARIIEREFGLSINIDADKSFNKDSKTEPVLLRISQKHKFEDHAETIRRKLKIIYKTSKPSTMSDFVMRLRNVGVATQICKDLNGLPNGIRYSVDGNKWLSGSSIKKTRFTWRALQTHEKISYVPERDNVALGLDSVTPLLMVHDSNDDISYIRGKLNSTILYNKPKTMTDLVVKLARCGVYVQATVDESGIPNGIKFSRDWNVWYSGSAIQKTKFSFNRLIERYGISYTSIDNIALGIGGAKQLDISVSMMITPRGVQRVRGLKKQGIYHHDLSVYTNGDKYRVCIPYRFFISQKEFVNVAVGGTLEYTSIMSAIVESFIEMIKKIIKAIFGCSPMMQLCIVEGDQQPIDNEWQSVSLIDNNKKMVDHNLIESRDYLEIKKDLERGLQWRLNPNNLEHVMLDGNIKIR